jgi:DNA mismatch endonuclease (patch repair protein)
MNAGALFATLLGFAAKKKPWRTKHSFQSDGPFLTNSLYLEKQMADVFTKAKRSKIMAAIRSTGNKSTELKLIAIMRRSRIAGWRRNSNAPGRPDFVFPRKKIAIFVDGCFWHGCPLHLQMPRSNCQFWKTKIARNIARDKAVNRVLRRTGWGVLRIWHHSLSSPESVASKIISVLSL